MIYLSNYKPIALANIIYKLYTSTLITFLTSYGKNIDYYILAKKNSDHNATHQDKTIIATFEDARLTAKDIYLTYIDFRNVFGSIDHIRLLAIMEDLGYLIDVVEIIENIYTSSTTAFTGRHFETTLLIKISQGTIQGDILSPYIFIIFLEPLLRWLEKYDMGYHFNTSSVTCTTTTYADNLINYHRQYKTYPTTSNQTL